MAKLIEGIFGAISGKLGPVTGGVWKGIPYLKLTPDTGKMKLPRSIAQIANEQKMKFLNAVLKPFYPYLAVGFQNLAIRKTAISAAYSMNYHQALNGVYPNLSIDYSKFMISAGPLPGLPGATVSLSAVDTLQVDWQQSNDAQARYNDQIMLVVYCPELNQADGFIGVAIRREHQCSLKIRENMQGKALEVYVGVTSFDRKKISNSQYLGRHG